MSLNPSDTLDAPDMGTSSLPGRILDIAIVRTLSRRSDVQGMLRATIHVGMLCVTGTLIYFTSTNLWLMIPAMVLHGFVIVTMFAPMHECVHRTAFATTMLNEAFGWFFGLMSFYNFHFYRHYHTWHHRYTQDPEKDPELSDFKPASFPGYLSEVVGLHFWPLRPWRFLKLAMGQTKNIPFVPESARRRIAISAGLQLTVYVVAVASIFMGHMAAWYYWFLPALLAQPFLRMITLAEHTGCTLCDDGLTNTRTTLTTFPVRLFMWNMPFHTEHHLYPSIPFHLLPQAHQELKTRLKHIVPGYVAAQAEVIQSFSTMSPGSTGPSNSTGATA
ncbi:MAG: fatty acid desaturase [Planctomycetaceae bacterium]